MKLIPGFYFNFAELDYKAAVLNREYKEARPFEHIVLDHFIQPEILKLVADEFPAIEEEYWKFWGPGDSPHVPDKRIEKAGISDERLFRPFTRHFLQQMNSMTFLRFLEKLTGYDGLIPDPTFGGCGLHSTGRGGRLMVHTDVNRHPDKSKRLHQILNAILFLNLDWRDDYGGHLELWGRGQDAISKNDFPFECEKRILPVFNRLVVFTTGKYSYHGHPVPLTCPEGRRRNSIALYYYMLDRPSDAGYEGYQPKVTWYKTSHDPQ